MLKFLDRAYFWIKNVRQDQSWYHNRIARLERERAARADAMTSWIEYLEVAA